MDTVEKVEKQLNYMRRQGVRNFLIKLKAANKKMEEGKYNVELSAYYEGLMDAWITLFGEEEV